MEMKKVCLLNGNLILRKKKTGVHLFHENVTKGLLSRKREYKIVSACFDFKGVCRKRISEKENQWMRPVLIISRLPKIFAYIIPIELFFGKNDVYICDGLYPHTIYKSAKKICIVHDLMVRIYPENYSVIRRIYLNMYYRSLKKADYVACVSENTKKDIIRFYGIDESKIKVIKCSYVESKSQKKCPDSRLIDGNRPFVFYIGDMRPNKNLKNTMMGFMDFCKKNPSEPVRMYLAGSWNKNYPSLKKFAEERGFGDRIIFLGYISDNDKSYLYRHGKAVLLVSEYEGFGIPIIEGFRYGIPVVTGSCSSMKELGEGAAVLADPYDISSISRGIEKAYFKEYGFDKKLAEKRAEEYSFPNVVRLTDEVIKEALK